MKHRTSIWVASCVALALVWAVGPAWAAATTYGTLRGEVDDEDGQPIAGAVLTLNSPSAIRELAVRTDGLGAYFASQLAPGVYTVTAAMQGYTSVRQEVTIRLDRTEVLDFTLPTGERVESVTVTADLAAPTSETKLSYNLNKENLESVPVGRAYQSLANLAPGVSDDDRDGNVNILGGTDNSNSWLLDGVRTEDAVTGTFGQNFNYDIVEEVDVKLTNISAEYGRFAGGVVDVLTKSGSNEYTGSVRDVITSPSFEGRYDRDTLGDFAPGTAPADVPERGLRELTHDFQTTLGGPIVRNRSWFFLAYTREDSVAIDQLGNPTGGLNADGLFNDTFQGDTRSIKVTYQATPRHKLQYAYNEDPAVTPRCYGNLFFGGPCYDVFDVDNQTQGGHTWTASWNATWWKNVLTDVRIGHWQNEFAISPLGPQPVNPDLIFASPGGLGSGLAAGPPATIALDTGALFDGTVFAAEPEVRERDQADLRFTTFINTKNTGSHTLKVGVDYQEQTRTGASVISGNALIFLSAPGAGLPSFYEQPPGLGGAGDPYDIDNRIYYLFYDFAEPGTGGPVSDEIGVFVQDDWTLNKHWAFNLGLRYEQYQDENDVGEKVIDQSDFAPRLGASYDVRGDRKHVVKATAARYLQAIILSTLSPFVRAAGGQSAYDIYANANLVPGDPAASTGTPDWQLLAQVRPDPTTSGFSPDLEPMHIDEYTLGYDFVFAREWQMRTRLIDREWSNVIGQQFTFAYPGGVATQILAYDNRDYLERTYQGILVDVEKRPTTWYFRGNFAHGRTDGNFTQEDGMTAYNAFPGVPQATQGHYGRLEYDVGTSAKLYGSYEIPLPAGRHALSVGSLLSWRTGTPHGNNSGQSGTTVVVGPGADGVQDTPLGTPGSSSVDQTASVKTYFEPRGTDTLPTVFSLDLQARYRFRFTDRTFFEGRFSVDNVTNEQAYLEVSDTTGYPTSFTQFQDPTTYEWNFALTW